MAKGTHGRRIASRQFRRAPYPMASHIHPNNFHKNCSKIKKDWEDATCSVCMENPHNAVLLLCSSHEKGCRPYMCGTSFRHSNCLDQYKKAYTKLDAHAIDENLKPTELACPLCRGQVKGWTVVEPAREHLNAKKRNCMQDNCSFVGTYKELRKHVRAEHPSAKPREVDPTLEHKWRGMEQEREREDVMSTIRSSVPGAVFFGDYVIEGNNRYGYGLDSDDDEDGFDVYDDRNEAGIDRDFMSVFLFLQAFGSAGNTRRHERDSDRNGMRLSRESGVGDFAGFDENNENDSDDEGNGNYGTSLAARLRRQGRVVMGGSRRRRRRREGGNGREDGF